MLSCRRLLIALLTFLPGPAAAISAGAAVPPPGTEQHLHAAIHHQEEAEHWWPQALLELGGITCQRLQVQCDGFLSLMC